MTDIRTRPITYELNSSGTTVDAYVKFVTLDMKGMGTVKIYLYNTSANSMTYKGVGYLTAGGTYTYATIAEAALAGTTGILIEKSSLVLDRIEFWVKSTVASTPADFTIEVLSVV